MKSLNTQIDGETLRGFKEYVKDQDTSQYQATRTLLDEGLRQTGYHPSTSTPVSRLQRALQQLTMAFALSGLILTGMSFTGNTDLQIYTITVFALAAVLYATTEFAGEHIDQLATRLGGVTST